MKAITVRQPWAWLLFHGKPIENRDWPTRYIGPLAIHTSARIGKYDLEDAVAFVGRYISLDLAQKVYSLRYDLVCGAIIGVVRQIGCVTESASPWFCGKYGHQYIDPVELQHHYWCKGKLGLWDIDDGLIQPLLPARSGEAQKL